MKCGFIERWEIFYPGGTPVYYVIKADTIKNGANKEGSQVGKQILKSGRFTDEDFDVIKSTVESFDVELTKRTTISRNALK